MKIPGLGLLAGLIWCAIGVATAAEVTYFEILKLGGSSVRWRGVGEGRAPVISYSIISDKTAFVGARNCRNLTNLDELAALSQLPHSSIREEVAAAFAMWETVANLSFREAPEPSTANILIGAQVEPKRWAYTDVFYDAQSSELLKPILKALICLNPTVRWKIGFDGDLRIYDLRYTIAHEIGHAIGLDHPSDAGQLMDYHYEERFRQPQSGDVQGARHLYGARQPFPLVTEEVRLPSFPAQPDGNRWETRAFPEHSR